MNDATYALLVVATALRRGSGRSAWQLSHVANALVAEFASCLRPVRDCLSVTSPTPRYASPPGLPPGFAMRSTWGAQRLMVCGSRCSEATRFETSPGEVTRV